MHAHFTDDSYIILTPAGVFEAFAGTAPNEQQQALQEIISGKNCPQVSVWTNKYYREWLEDFLGNGWIEFLENPLSAPNLPLDKFLPYVVASLSGTRRAAIGSNEGFCLARVGYTQEEADTLSVAAADFFDFLNRQKQRGWVIKDQAVSFFEQVDLLMPTTSFVFLWIDDSGYVLILDGEPLTNNRAFVELIWAIKTSGLRFEKTDDNQV